MEATITLDPLFEQAMVLGEGRPYLAALLVLSRVGWTALAGRLRLDPDGPQALRAPAATAAVLGRLATVLERLPAHVQAGPCTSPPSPGRSRTAC